MSADGKHADGGEHDTFLGKRPDKPQKKGFAAFIDFLWDKEQKKFLGRGGMSWLEITIFYIIFYSVLAAFWAVSLALFVYTLKDDRPQWYGKGTIIGINPGVGYQPWLRDDPDSTLIYINLSEKEEGGGKCEEEVEENGKKVKKPMPCWKKYVKQLDAYLKKYDDKNNTRLCEGGQSNKDLDVKESCRFELSTFNECAPGKGDGNYGYKEGKPCVLLSLNRLIDWQPVAYPVDSAPAFVAERYEPGFVTIGCHGESAVDNEHIGTIKYYPPAGMDKKYFPYRVMANYHQPTAMVKFENLHRDIVVQVECLAFAYNILHDPHERMGLIHFEIMIDSKPPPTRS